MIYISNWHNIEDLSELYKEWTGKQLKFDYPLVNTHLIVARELPDKMEVRESMVLEGDPGKFIGVLQLILIYAPTWDLHWGLIQDVYVAKGYRRQGIATKLIKFAEAQYSWTVCSFFRLTTEFGREGTEQLYKKLGYVAEGFSFMKMFGESEPPWIKMKV